MWVADGEVGYSGSFDFSGNRDGNEDCLVVTQNLPLVREREGEFRRRWNSGRARVAEAVAAEHRNRFRTNWYPTDGPQVDPEEPVSASGGENSSGSSPRGAYCQICGRRREDHFGRRFCAESGRGAG